MRRLLLSLTVIFSFLLLAAGCSVKNANSLVRMAIRDHGDADVVSKVETEDHTEVILKDKLQGFEYKVTSRMDDINVDGAHFGSLPGT